MSRVLFFRRHGWGGKVASEPFWPVGLESCGKKKKKKEGNGQHQISSPGIVTRLDQSQQRERKRAKGKRRRANGIDRGLGGKKKEKKRRRPICNDESFEPWGSVKPRAKKKKKRKKKGIEISCPGMPMREVEKGKKKKGGEEKKKRSLRPFVNESAELQRKKEERQELK